MAAISALPRTTAQPLQKRSSTPQRGRAGRRCQWCNRKLTGRHANTCCASCRSSLSRKKRSTCVNTLVELGMPKAAAERLLMLVGLRMVERKMNDNGWQWQPQRKTWVDTREAQRRAA